MKRYLLILLLALPVFAEELTHTITAFNNDVFTESLAINGTVTNEYKGGYFHEGEVCLYFIGEVNASNENVVLSIITNHVASHKTLSQISDEASFTNALKELQIAEGVTNNFLAPPLPLTALDDIRQDTIDFGLDTNNTVEAKVDVLFKALNTKTIRDKNLLRHGVEHFFSPYLGTQNP